MNDRDGCIEKYLVLKKENTVLLAFILQGYEGFAIATTIDKTRAIVKLFIMDDFVSDIEDLLKSLNVELGTADVSLSPDQTLEVRCT